ncbi:MAG: S-layer homology domain-containing protein [Candidatus Gracilibacteria bacterium]|nr:S-layer homology domain-containing protein [Candidatus Gracilibacteria bacterium]
MNNLSKYLLLLFLASLFLIPKVTTTYAEAIDCDGNLFGYQKRLCLEQHGTASILSQPVQFKDIEKHRYESAVKYVQENNIVNGYSDKTFKPNNVINRAEFTKILILGKLQEEPSSPSEPCFKDVENGVWFEKYVCYAKSNNILGGYPDGSFRPVDNINFAEASKIISNTFTLPTEEPKEDQPWYVTFMDALSQKKAIPGSISKHNHNITRAEMAEMIMRINKGDTTHPSLTTCDLISSTCQSDAPGFGDSVMTGINMKTVRTEWLNWYNQEREKIGLHPYTYNNQLNRSAFVWSDTMKERESVSHKREGESDFYNYDIIKNWFNNLNLDFENVQRVTFSENIGAGQVICSDDCTQELITAIKSTFDAYMAEKGSDDAAHYNSIMNKYFNEIGLGIALDKEKNKYYLSVHYGTKLK